MYGLVAQGDGRFQAAGDVDSIDFWAARVRQLEAAIECEQKKIMTGTGWLPLNLHSARVCLAHAWQNI